MLPLDYRGAAVWCLYPIITKFAALIAMWEMFICLNRVSSIFFLAISLLFLAAVVMVTYGASTLATCRPVVNEEYRRLIINKYLSVKQNEYRDWERLKEWLTKLCVFGGSELWRGSVCQFSKRALTARFSLIQWSKYQFTKISEKYKPMNHDEQQAESTFTFYKVVITVSFFVWVAVIFGGLVEEKM